MVRSLLVANKTLASGEVSRFVRERIANDDSCQFTLLVPATPQRDKLGSRLGTRSPTLAPAHEYRTRPSAWTIGSTRASAWSTG